MSYFVTWKEGDDKGHQLAIAQMSSDTNESNIHERAAATSVYRNMGGPGMSIRDGFNRSDYDLYRPSTARPTEPRKIIKACNDAYKQHGIFRNIIELMSDFTVQGIDLNHPNPTIEKFYKEWFRKIGGEERSERFVNYLYRNANVIVKRKMATLSNQQEKRMRLGHADEGEVGDREIPVKKREIPFGYTFIKPWDLDIVEPELSLFSGEKMQFSVEISSNIIRKIKTPKNEAERKLIATLPKEIVNAVRRGEKRIVLDPNKVSAFYYKRDDWDPWATPFVFPILTDLALLLKMKDADWAALDGAVSCIRVWKLGSGEHRMLPTSEIMEHLSNMLMNNVGGGVMDLVWNPYIELMETSTEVHKFLGHTKYEPVLSAIYSGLGIPSSLAGDSSSNGDSGFTNNAMSLKTIMERLQYGRNILKSFWDEEIRIVQKAMDFRHPASLVFDYMTLMDESTERRLWIELVDRDYISVEALQERFGLTPEIEEVRIRREKKMRDDGMSPPKAGPYHTAEKEHELKKAFVSTQTITPSEVGLELEEKKRGEKTPVEITNKFSKKVEPNTPNGGTNGRPAGKGDDMKRKQKVVKPRTSASEYMHMLSFAESAQATIGPVITKAYLQSKNKKNLRELTTAESDGLEKTKLYLLFNTEPDSKVDEKSIAGLMQRELTIPAKVDELIKFTVGQYVQEYGKEPPLEILRRYYSGAYALWHGDFDQ